MTDLSAIRFDRDAWNRLILIQGTGETSVGVEPVRCFPLTEPEKSIAILDSEGRELLTIADLGQLNAEARQTLQAELAARDFVPQIQRVISTTHPSPPCDWVVETDRGRTSFRLESEDDIRKLGSHRIMIADSNGIRYLIPDTRTLDASTQRIVQRLVLVG